MNEKLGNRIKVLRNIRNYTQEYIADKIGVSGQNYARIEIGEDYITLDILSKIALILNVTVGDITSVLDDTPTVEYEVEDKGESAKVIFEMLDLFYSNKHICEKLKRKKVI